jgi:hypothetical protein
VLDPNDPTAAERGGTVDRVLKLPHVPRPRMNDERLSGVTAQQHARAGALLEEMVCQEQDVLRPRPQRRQDEVEDLQSPTCQV